MLFLVAVLAGMVAFSSYVRRAAGKARSELASRRKVRIEIPLAGSGMATRAEMRQRYALEEELVRRRLGIVTDGASGGGRMWIIVAVAETAGDDDLQAAIAAAGLDGRAAVSPSP
jgi:hypothetical protein